MRSVRRFEEHLLSGDILSGDGPPLKYLKIALRNAAPEEWARAG
jgi:hypothetical protein